MQMEKNLSPIGSGSRAVLLPLITIVITHHHETDHV